MRARVDTAHHVGVGCAQGREHPRIGRERRQRLRGGASSSSGAPSSARMSLCVFESAFFVAFEQPTPVIISELLPVATSSDFDIVFTFVQQGLEPRILTRLDPREVRQTVQNVLEPRLDRFELVEPLLAAVLIAAAAAAERAAPARTDRAAAQVRVA